MRVCESGANVNQPKYVGFQVANPHAYVEFPEDTLPLLGPSIHTLSPTAYLLHVSSLFVDYHAKDRKIVLKGKMTQTATKKRNGEYKLTREAKEINFAFTKERVAQIDVALVCELLGCDATELKTFLEKKKFRLPDLAASVTL